MRVLFIKVLTSCILHPQLFFSAVRLRLKFNYGQLHRLFSPSPNKVPPLHFSHSTYPPIVFGLARSLFRLPQILPAVVFFCHTFCSPHTKLAHCFFSFLKKIKEPIHPQGKKDIRYSNHHHRT